MDLATRFHAAVAKVAANTAEAAEDLVPMILSQACVQVLPIAGAGLSMTHKLRLPLGASDEAVARAERLQTTLGDGPCLAAADADQPLVAGLTEIAEKWPIYHLELLKQTPFRSLVSVPLRSRHGVSRGALDLYLEETELPRNLSVEDTCRDVADPIGQVLFDDLDSSLGKIDFPAWLDGPAARNRMHVWVAVGKLMESVGYAEQDALAALRAYAFSHDDTLDHVAHELMHDRLWADAIVS